MAASISVPVLHGTTPETTSLPGLVWAEAAAHATAATRDGEEENGRSRCHCASRIGAGMWRARWFWLPLRACLLDCLLQHLSFRGTLFIC